ncbi:hypothetical protein DH2020_034031 [Rehmannia glutinosa]|uniref:Uncharacterized protein n=1 Tax=Rehmannia glutinosa TaxID=99300 RepID=A0ABR0VD08_REHGL
MPSGCSSQLRKRADASLSNLTERDQFVDCEFTAKQRLRVLAMATKLNNLSDAKLMTFGKQKERTDGRSDASKSKGTVDSTETLDDEQNLVTSISTELTSTEVTGVGENSVGLTNNAVIVKKKKEYEDPWDQDDNTRMLFFKFPSILPGYKSTPPSETSKGKEIADSSSRASKGKEISESSENRASGDPSKTSESSKISGLEDLPKGYIGKMLVYKSGDVKLKLGDVLCDVSPGCACIVSRHVMAMNTDDRHCSYLGDVNQRAVVTPEVDSLLDMI